MYSTNYMRGKDIKKAVNESKAFKRVPNDKLSWWYWIKHKFHAFCLAIAGYISIIVIDVQKREEKKNENEEADYYIYMLIFIRNV